MQSNYHVPISMFNYDESLRVVHQSMIIWLVVWNIFFCPQLFRDGWLNDLRIFFRVESTNQLLAEILLFWLSIILNHCQSLWSPINHYELITINRYWSLLIIINHCSPPVLVVSRILRGYGVSEELFLRGSAGKMGSMQRMAAKVNDSRAIRWPWGYAVNLLGLC